MAEAFGADRRAAVCRELTKTYEEVRRGPLRRAGRLGRRRRTRRGHPGGGRRAPVPTDLAEAVRAVRALTATGSRLQPAVAEVALRTGRGQEQALRAGALQAARRRMEESDRVDLPERPEPLPAPVVDTHCHLDVTEQHSGLTPDRALAWAAEVGRDPDRPDRLRRPGSRWAVAAAERWPNVVAGVAIHPNDAARLGAGLPEALAVIEELARTRGSGRWGRPGWTTTAPASRPGTPCSGRRSPRTSRWPSAYDKTLVIHDRDAHAEVLECSTPRGVPDAGRDALLLRRRRRSPGTAWTAAPTCPSPGPVTFKPNAVAAGRARGRPRWTGCWWRPTRRT